MIARASAGHKAPDRRLPHDDAEIRKRRGCAEPPIRPGHGHHSTAAGYSDMGQSHEGRSRLMHSQWGTAGSRTRLRSPAVPTAHRARS